VKIFTDFENLGFLKNAVVTTGSFDGVHRGHKVILQRLKKLAFETGGETVLITFHPHPRKVLYPDTIGKDLFLLNSQQEKIELLRKAGLDNLIIVNFTLAFSKISSVEFVKNILLNKIHAKKIVIGGNHHFGHNREGDSEKMHQLGVEYGFDVEEIPEQEIEDESISSGKIREALLEGNIEKANTYLDHPYIIMGELKDTRLPDNEMDFPVFSLRIEEESKLIPKDGVYAISALDSEHLYRGLCFIKKKGSSSTEAGVLFYLISKPAELSGTTATILFHKFIREEINFASPKDMNAQWITDQSQLDELVF
jgi:riboflavin kinase / FMN adenylyltransferase